MQSPIADKGRERPTAVRFRASLDDGLFAGLLALVILAPLPLGSNKPFPLALLAVVIGAMLICQGITAGLGSAWTNTFPTPKMSRRLKWPFLLYTTVCLWVLIQWVPWPFGQNFGDPLWRSASNVLGVELAGRITANPMATLTALMRLLTYGGVFYLTLQLADTPKRARTALQTVAIAGTVYALYGLLVFFSGNDWILIYRKWAYQTDLTGTFVNRNNFATFAGLSLLCVTAIFSQSIRPVLALRSPPRQKFALLVETVLQRSAWTTAAFLAIFLALLLTGSRAGIGSSLAGLLVFLLLQPKQGRRRARRSMMLVGILLVLIFPVFLLGGARVVDRLGSDGVSIDGDLRQTFYITTIEAIQTTPLTGTGAGTYPDTIEAYRTGTSSSLQVEWDKAHNTYLENGLELGVPAAVALTLSVGWMAFIALGGVRARRHGRIYPALGIAATVLVGLHSLLDFSLQMPAVAVLYAFLLGLAVTQSRSQTASEAKRPGT